MPISSIPFHPWTPPNEGVRPLQLPCIGGCGLGAPLVQKGRPSNFGRTWSASCMLATHFSLKKSSSSKARWNPVVWLATSLNFLFGQTDDYRKKLAEGLLGSAPSCSTCCRLGGATCCAAAGPASSTADATDPAAARGSLVSMKNQQYQHFQPAISQSVGSSVSQLAS